MSHPSLQRGLADVIKNPKRELFWTMVVFSVNTKKDGGGKQKYRIMVQEVWVTVENGKCQSLLTKAVQPHQHFDSSSTILTFDF